MRRRCGYADPGGTDRVHRDELPFGDVAKVPRDDDALVEEGIIDSTGILELIEFLESHFGIEVSEAETIPQNLGASLALPILS